MINYFIRRLLMVIPTFIGVTFIVFTITRFAPGGPVEMAILKYRQMQFQSEGGSTIGSGGTAISEEMVEKLKRIYGFDKPFYISYLLWLWKVVRFDLGESYTYSRPVWDVIRERFPISLRFGITGFLLSYLVCIPLGILKAIKHKSFFDFISSAIVFIGYAIPGWVAGIVLLVLFGGGSFLNIFPLGGIHSLDYENLTLIGKIWDNIHHMILPVFCYTLGSFATLTILMKNSLIENLAQDYVRTAFAKGLSERTVILKHVLRNSLIPIATGLGGVFSIILSGSFLIEKVFNIHGFGMLGYNSILDRDYPVMLGILVFSSVLYMIGNIFSDFLYCIIDPRIRLD
ncbi:MAG: ABC transporter permease subunit [candidate division WOR-3 bacterium]